MTEIVLPHHSEAERSILGAILLENKLIEEANHALRVDDFHLPSHKIIYRAMLELYEEEQPIDIITLRSVLKNNNVTDDRYGGATYLAALLDGVPRSDTIAPYLGYLKDASILRRLIWLGNGMVARCQDMGGDTVQEVIERASQELYRLATRTQAKLPEHFSTIAERVVERINRSAQSKEELVGLSTGYIDLDGILLGLEPCLTVIGARPQHGKTSLGLCLGKNAAKKGNVVLYQALESTAERLAMRLIAGEAKIDSQRLRAGKLNFDELQRLKDAVARLSDLPLYIDDTASMTVTEMRSSARRFKVQHGLDLMLIDYLGLITPAQDKRGESSEKETAGISKGLVTMWKELNIPVIALHQLSRKCEDRANKRPRLSDFRDSGQIEQDTDIAIFLYNESVYKETDQNRGVVEAIIAKNRDGACATVKLTFLKQYVSFENYWHQETFKTLY